MRRLLITLLFITAALAPSALASWGSSLPSACDQGDFFIRTDNTIWWCDSTNHWTVLPSSVAAASASDHSITPCGANTFATGLSTTWALTCNQPSASNLTDGTTGTGAVVRSTSPSVATPTVSGNLTVSGGNIVQTVSSGNIANTFTNTTASGNASTMQLTGNNTAGVTSNYWGVSHADSSQTTRWSWGFNASLALSWWSRQTSYPAGFTAGDVTQMTLDTSGNLTATGKLLGTGVDAINSGYQVELANDTTTGTAQRLLVKLTGSPSKVRTTATTDTAGALGICALGCSTSGAAVITLRGFETCTFDGATTAGDFVSISSSTAGNCHDSGSSRPTNATQIVGRVLSTNASGGTYTVWLTPDDTGTVSGACTNQAVTGVTLGTGIGCSTITSAFVNNTIAITGSDINTSSQVTATHLSSALPIAQGGTGAATAGAYTTFGNNTNSTAAPSFVSLPGKPQSFELNITNTAGTIQHRIYSDALVGTASNWADRVTGASGTLANTPQVNSSTGFTNGVGVDASALSHIVFNTAAQTSADLFGQCTVTYNDTATTDVRCALATTNINVNGTTQVRTSFWLLSGGSSFSVNTTNIATGKSISIRFNGYIK